MEKKDHQPEELDSKPGAAIKKTAWQKYNLSPSKTTKLQIGIIAACLLLVLSYTTTLSLIHKTHQQNQEHPQVESQRIKRKPTPTIKPTTTVTPTILPTIQPTVIQPANGFYPVGQLEETNTLENSPNPSWWVNSGALLTMNGTEAHTIQGELPLGSKWQQIYARSNAYDTDNGLHPQNIFRLVNKQKMLNYEQQAYFRINKYNVSQSENRNQSNGILLFNRYQTGQTLYYTGLRVDGAAVIKKKINGNYYTMAYKPYFPGKWERNINPNLIPLETWIGIKSMVINENNGVHIELFFDVGKTGTWTKAIEAFDTGTEYGGAAITKAGFAGIRTDFIDVGFENYEVKSL